MEITIYEQKNCFCYAWINIIKDKVLLNDYYKNNLYLFEKCMCVNSYFLDEWYLFNFLISFIQKQISNFLL